MKYRQPKFRLVANKEDITETIASRLSTLTVTDETGFESDTLEIVLTDHDPKKRIALPPTGAEVHVFIGYDEDLQDMGLFVIDEVVLHGPPMQFTIRGHAAIFDATPDGKVPFNSQKTRSWPKGTTFGALAAKVAKEHGMKLSMTAELQKIPLPHIDQKAESDLHLLLRLGKIYDCITKPAGGVLAIVSRGKLVSATGQPLPKIKVQGKELHSYTLQVSTKEGAGQVAAFYHPFRKAKMQPVVVGKGMPVKKLRNWFKSKAEALAAAQAEYNKRLRNMRKVTFSFPGRPEVAAEYPLVVEDLREDFDGEWVVTRAVHALEGNGYTTSVEGTTLVALQIEALAEAGEDAEPTIDLPDEEKPDDMTDDHEPPDDEPASEDTTTDPEPVE